MDFNNNSFFSDNIAYVNRLVAKVLYFTLILAPLFYILSKKGIFDISHSFCIFTAIMTTSFCILQTILVFGFGSNQFKIKFPNAFNTIQVIAMYFGMGFSAVMLGILGTNPHIGIYISYALVIFLSCLYYNTKITLTMSVICYLTMVGSLFIKSVNRYAEKMAYISISHDFIAFCVGYSIEFLFVFIITMKLTRRNHNSMKAILDKNIKIENTNAEILKFIPEILKKHNLITGYHTEHTVSYVEMICRELLAEGLFTDILTPDTIKMYSIAANLHDIGKIFIPDHILNTPRRYTPQEYEMMKLHPLKGKQILESMPLLWDGEFNKIAIDMAYCHHERYDGTGYPQQLKGNDIPFCARIMSVADVLDALLSRRPYKKQMSISETMNILREGKGTQFDPVIVDAALQIQPLIYMYSQDVAAKEYDKITEELNWRQKNMDSLLKGEIISEEQQRELMQNS
ncbi:MAG: HD-GYP domain-containing protein [Treponema sp.]|nr:HD-GYP domain-containing protein [Treponema sp.]